MHLRFDRAGRLTHLVHSGSSCLWVIHASRQRDHGNTGLSGMMKLDGHGTWQTQEQHPRRHELHFFSKRGLENAERLRKKESSVQSMLQKIFVLTGVGNGQVCTIMQALPL